MGFGDWIGETINEAGDALEGGLSDLEHAAGTVLDDGAHLLGKGLDAFGLHGAAQTVDDFGDGIADHLGAQVAEQQLGATDDPAHLIHGDLAAIGQTATHLHKFAEAFGETARGLGAIEVSHWQGDAAEAFHETYRKHPKQWADAQEACSAAARAWEDYAHTVQWAQGQAREAIALYQQGMQASKQAKLSAPADPGAAMRQHAHEILDSARRQRDSAARQAQAAISKATSTAPAEPSFSERTLDNVGDLFHGAAIENEHFLGGILKGTGGLLKFVRSLNPMDTYNITHPAQYLDGLSSTAAGLVHATQHPVELLQGLVGTGWGEDPAEAFGHLLPAVALAVATDGAGAAAGIGERAALGVGERAALDAAERTAAEVGEDISANAGGAAARETPQVPCVKDPVDVAGGRVLLTQTDVELAGILPLVLSRTHLSSYRVGRWFGPSWASTLDQRLEIEDTGVYYAAEDGMLLAYPVPDEEGAVLPEEGPRWPLRRAEDGGYTITDPKRGRTLRFGSTGGATMLPLRAIIDRSGHRIDVDYDQDGAPCEVRHSGGYRIGVETTGRRITELRLRGADSNADAVLIRYGYDSGRLNEVTNSSGVPLRFDYDAEGRLTGWQDRNDVAYCYTYDEAGRCVRTSGAAGRMNGIMTYDPDARLTVSTDSLGRDTTFHLNERGQVIREYDPLGRVTISAWNRHDQLFARTDPVGRTTRYVYDPAGNLIEIIRPDGSRALAEYNELNLPITLTDPDGATWRRTYDECGNLTSVTDPLDTTTRYAYDDKGHLASVTDALDHVHRIQTNAAGLLTAVTDSLGVTTHYTRDGFGRISTVTDPVGGVTQFAWTTEGKLAQRTLPDGSTEHWSYDAEGNLVEHIDALGQVTRTEIGPFDLPTARIGPDGARLEFCYDTELRLVSVTNPQALVWRYDYDPAGNLISETDFNHRELRYVRDNAGQLIERTNGAGQLTHFARDLLGNVVEQRSGDALTTFAYDPAGRVTRATNADAELVIERDALGRALAETCNGRTITSRYDALGRRTHRCTPSGAESIWEYGARDAPVALHTAGHTLRFGYDPAGREIERHLGAGAVLAQSWDVNHRLAAQTLTAGGSGLGLSVSAGETRLVQHRFYGYRPDGYVTTIDDHLTGLRRFDLDPSGRVTAVHAAGWIERYAYDPAGNITDAVWPTPPPDSSPDADATGQREYTGTLIRRAGNIRYQHDAQGRIILRRQKRLSAKPRTWHYTWDADDRLIGVTTPDGARWRYRYDPFGRRVAKQRVAADGVSVAEQLDFSWDGVVLAEQTHTIGPDGPARTTAWDWEPNSVRPLTQTERAPLRDAPQEWVDDQFYAIVTDLIGTPTELVEPDGNLAWHPRTTLWGTTTSSSPDGASCPLRFPGQYHDPETGFNYNYHRYYDPVSGRYESNDPLALAAGPNPHIYVLNPTGWTDPLGLAPQNCIPVGFAPGEGESALTANRLQHGTRHLTEEGVLPAWSGKSSPEVIRKSLSPVLEHPAATFDWKLGADPVKGFLGDVNGKQVAVFVFKEGPYQGQLATAYVPKPNQLAKWGF